MSNFIPPGLGWQRDLPDPRDFTPESQDVRDLLSKLPENSESNKSGRKTLPKKIDLRQNGDGHYFSEVEDQQGLNCSCACAVVGLIEYFERRAHGHNFEGSKLFLHQMSLCLAGLPIERPVEQADKPTTFGIQRGIAVSMRTTLKALTRFGLPPEELWPYRPELYHVEPTRLYLTGYAKEYQPLRYFRLDAGSGQQSLTKIKSYLASGFPIAFGIPIPNSVTLTANIPYRPTFDSIRGGQAVLAVGYDDIHPGSTRGALIIRNSWGSTWGANGYGWLPYAYVRNQVATDFWTIARPDWMERLNTDRPADQKAKRSPTDGRRRR